LISTEHIAVFVVESFQIQINDKSIKCRW